MQGCSWSRFVRIIICLLLAGHLLCFRSITAAEKPAIHVIVALCDNKHQGIVPVSKQLGDGQNPDSNLYWGALYGVRTYFRKSSGWQEIRGAFAPGNGKILERVIFRHTSSGRYMIADAFDGRNMREALQAFLTPSAVTLAKRVALESGDTLLIGEDAALRAFVGHNGLMDTRLPVREPGTTGTTPAIVLCCMSQSFFTPHLKAGGLEGWLLTTGLMAPEAYTLEAALSAWAGGENPEAVRNAAAKAYAKYQRCSLSAARKLIITQARATTTTVLPQTQPDGRTIQSLPTPRGAIRITYRDPFAVYVRTLPLKPENTPVRAWDGSTVPMAGKPDVIDWAAPSRVQQCADVAIRLRAEYLLASHRQADIAFRSLSNDEIRYDKWLAGRYRVNAAGTRIGYAQGTRIRQHSTAEFEKYLLYVMTYANSASLARDLPKIGESAVRPGDLYIQPDSRGGVGHVTAVLDACARDNKRFFLIGQGFIPARDFHLLVPQAGEGESGWFTLPGLRNHVATFGKGSFHRFR